jgi:hypothetical protein
VEEAPGVDGGGLAHPAASSASNTAAAPASRALGPAVVRRWMERSRVGEEIPSSKVTTAGYPGALADRGWRLGLGDRQLDRAPGGRPQHRPALADAVDQVTAGEHAVLQGVDTSACDA